MTTTLTAPLLPVTGASLQVPLATGGLTRYVNLDSAASTVPLLEVEQAVANLTPWYSSVHRGAGFASLVSTDLYEWAREQVHGFVGAGPDDMVVFTRNTTEALNLAAATLPLEPGTAILTTLVEHHANLLPWRRRGKVVQLPPPPSAEDLLASLAAALADPDTPIGIVAMTGASNVTGEVFPVAQMARLAHDHGALFVLDAAQLAPHRPMDMTELGIDALALSGHKMHAPYGTGALVVRRELIDQAEPLLAGGGAVDIVSDDNVAWTHGPERHEAGTPNVIGAVALGVACKALRRVGMDVVATHERDLLTAMDEGLARIDGITRYRLWSASTVDRLGLATFNLGQHPHGATAGILSAEHGVGVRDGCFCAHPYMMRLLQVDGEDEARHRADILAGNRRAIPGAVRASVSVGTTIADIEALLTALDDVARRGSRLSYREDDHGAWTPDPDPRPRPNLDTLLSHAPVT